MTETAKTERLTRQWRLNVEAAKELTERCRAKSRALSSAFKEIDITRSNAFGDYAALASYYRDRFEDWAQHDVTREQKKRELAAFWFIQQAVYVELEESVPLLPRGDDGEV